MSAVQASIGIALITVAAAGAIGYGLFNIINVKGKAVSPNEFGRKWFAWAVFASTFAALPKFLRQWDADSFAAWLLAIVVFGGVAYLLGWIIGKFLGVGGQPTVSAEPDSGIADGSDEFMSEDGRLVDTFNESPAVEEEIDEDDEKIYSDPEIRDAPEILSENALYEIAWKETESKSGDRGLWAKAYSACEGDKEKTRAYYMRERVKYLQATQLQRVQEYRERKKKEEEEEMDWRRQAEERDKALKEEIRKLIEKRKSGIQYKAGYQDKDVARHLLSEIGITDINRRYENHTPLMTAAKEGHKNIVYLLLLAGADTELQSTFGKTAFEIARDFNHNDIALLISEEARKRWRY